MLTAEQFDALCLLTKGQKVTLSEETAQRLVARGYIERSLGSWRVTSRGHARILHRPETSEAT